MRKPIAVVAVLAFMALWIWGAGTIGSGLTGAPGWLQLVYYLIAGLGWILPLRPVFVWMNSGVQPDED